MYNKNRLNQIISQAFRLLSVASVAVLGGQAFAATNLVTFNTATELPFKEVGAPAAEYRSSGGASGGATDGYLSITDAKSGQRATVVFDDLDKGLVVKAFTFECDLRVGGGTAQPADGFSLNYVRADDPLAANGSPFAGTAGENDLPEEGSLTGLGIGFDTWQSGDHPGGIRDVVGISIRVEGQLLTQLPVPLRPGNVWPGGTYDEAPFRNLATTDANYASSMQTGALNTTDDLNADGTAGNDANVGQVTFDDPKWPLWVKNLKWEKFKAQLTEEGKVKIFWKGVELTPAGGLSSSFSPAPGRLVFGGRTGGAWEVHHVDNIRLETVPANEVIIGGAVGNPIGFSITTVDSGSAIAVTTGLSVKLNGTDISSKVSVAKDGITSTIAYGNAAAPLASGSTNKVEISVKDTLGRTVSATREFVVGSYVTIPAGLAVTGVDTSKKGFNVRTHQTARRDQPNTIARAEQQLLGLRGDNVADLTGFTGGVFAETGVINYSQSTSGSDATPGQNGAFSSSVGAVERQIVDNAIPGVPSATEFQWNGDFYTDNIAAEITTYLQFPTAGVYTLTFNSDDGFRTTVGGNNKEVLNSLVVSEADYGKGASDINATVFVAAAGAYPFRTVWFEGGGGANLEWSAQRVAPNPGARYLINHTAADAVKAFRAASGPTPAAVSFIHPFRNSGGGYVPTAPVVVSVADGSTPVDQASFALLVDGAAVTPTKASAGGVTTYTYKPSANFAPGNHTVIVRFTAGAQKYDATNTFSTLYAASVAGSLALPASAVNTGNKGFLVKTIQQENGEGMGNDTYRGLTHIAGLIGTKNVADLALFGANGYYVETGVINYNQDAVSSGYFPDDPGVPGIPGTTGNTDNFAQEVLTVLDLKAGFYCFNVNSDDGFRLDIGNPGEAFTFPVVVGEFSGGRGNGGGVGSGTTFFFNVEKDGLYPARLIWYEGGGGANVEFSARQFDPVTGDVLSGNLINAAGGINAYQYPLSSKGVPFVKSYAPSQVGRASSAAPYRAGTDASITAKVVQGTGPALTAANVSVKVDGATATATVTTVDGIATVTVAAPAGGWVGGSTHTVDLTIIDRTVSWVFGVANMRTPVFAIEAEDFDNNGVAPAATSVMPYRGGALAGQSASNNKDYTRFNEGASPIYRIGEDPQVPMDRTGDRDRGVGELDVNFKMGWIGDGQWYQYTRTFPAGDYNVYAGLSHGDGVDSATRMKGQFATVASANVTVVGSFESPSTGGWGNNALVPMRNVDGSLASVKLSGQQTVRFNASNGDFDFLLLTPALPGNVLSKDDTIVPSSSNYPGGEAAQKVIDGLSTTKYLNFDKVNTGFTVTPKVGASVISGISITTANDAPERDPATWQILGSNNGTDFEAVASGSLEANPTRFNTTTLAFSNTKFYTSYKVVFPSVVNAAKANSMQVAEVALHGIILDTDKDQIPDYWEIKYGFNINSSADAQQDPDSDGFNNLAEYLSGTDPKDMTPPLLESAIAAASGKSVKVIFNEKIDPVTAGNISNYKITPNISIISASVNGSVVILTTTQQSLNGTDYTISVDNVQDLSKKTILANSKVIFQSVVSRREMIVAWWDFEKVESDGVTINSVGGGYVGQITQNAEVSGSGGGRPSGGKGLMISPDTNRGQLVIEAVGDANPLNVAAVDDSLTITVWQKNNRTPNSSTFWAVSEDSDRSTQAHIPWSDGSIYWDTSGCCGGDTRISQWPAGHDYNSWHLYSLVKRGGTKEIWVDGNLLISQDGYKAHSTLNTKMFLGGDPSGNNILDATIDDFVIWKGALNPEQIKKLASGAKPSDLLIDTDKDGMLDYWETQYGFNPNDPADAKADPDADGFDNVTEYNAGTDPKDMTRPSLVGASASASGTTFTVTFSEKVDPVTASNVANYSVSPALSVTAAAVKGNTVTLTTAKQTLDGTEYTISVSNVQDLSKKTIVAASKVSAYAFITLRNGIAKFSAWLGISGGLQNLLDDARYQAGTPDVVGAMFGMNSRDVFPTDANDNYGATMEALLTPTETGSYRFFIYTDDTSQLFLSTDDKAANLVQIAEETGCCNYFSEPGSPRTSEPIALTAGKKYFVRLVYKEFGGADYGQVAWRKEGDATPASALRPIDGKFLSAEAVAPPTGFIKSVMPIPKTVGASNNIEIVHVDGRTVQTAATTSLEVDGVKVNANIEKSGIFLTVRYNANPGFAPNSRHTAKFNYLDMVGKPTSYSWDFGINPLNHPNIIFIEAEDFDFDRGQTITDQNIGLNGKYKGGAFEGKGGVAGVDFNNPGGNAGQPYRASTGVAAGKGPNKAEFPGSEWAESGRNRGLFEIDVNYTVGWNDPGDWQNYTRTFPTPAKKYSVYGFASSGASPIHFSLDQVTAGVGTEIQTLKPLAELKPGRATAGWDSLEIFPFTDPVTKSPSVLELGGKMTLRITLPAGNGDIDFLAFVPIDESSSGGNDVSQVQVQSVTPLGSDVVVPVTVTGFNLVETVQFTIGWDPSILEYRGVSKFGLNGMTESSFATSSQSGRTNKLSFSWDDSTLAGVTLTNGSSLFNLNFKVLGNATGTANIVFENQPTGLEVSSQGKVVSTRSVNGVVTIVSSLAGAVEYYASVGGKVAGVKVELSNGSTGITDVAGAFSVNYQPGVNYTLTPSYVTDSPIANGVTTADITLIRRHVLGLAILDSPYKVLAGDVNGSDSVTTADITLIRRLILGISTNFSSGLWRFVPSDETFVDMTKPWTAKRMRQYVSLASGKLPGQDFKAIKMGDVNGSWKAPTAGAGSITKSKAKGRLTIGKVGALAGEIVKIPVSLAGVNRLGTLQMTLSWDDKAASFEGVEGLILGGLSQENLGLTRVMDGKLSLSWDHPLGRGVELGDNAELFHLKLRLKDTAAKRIEIQVTEGPTRLELTDGDTEVLAGVNPGWVEINSESHSGAGLVSFHNLGLNPDGSVLFEVRAPKGIKVGLEMSESLSNWIEVQVIIGQGVDVPIKISSTIDIYNNIKFWRLKAY